MGAIVKMPIRIGVDASNLRDGGGVTHLVHLLGAADPSNHEVERIVLWGGRNTLEQVPVRPWLDLVHQPDLDRALPARYLWRRGLPNRLRERACDLLFVPGGTYLGPFRPYVTMFRNMLPFDYREMRRYGCSAMFVKLLLLRRAQAATFRNADGLIFLSEFARATVERAVNGVTQRTALIPHGVDVRFRAVPRQQRGIASYSMEKPFRLLYVSAITVYKHQWHVVEAVARMRRAGVPVCLDLIGPGYPPSLRRLQDAVARRDPFGEFVRYLGAVPNRMLAEHYRCADAFVFASTCENLPNTLLEAMAAGLPIACSSSEPMPEVLGDAGVYFDAERPEDIARALRTLIEDAGMRERFARSAVERAQGHTWERCAEETFAFLASVARYSRSRA